MPVSLTLRLSNLPRLRGRNTRLFPVPQIIFSNNGLNYLQIIHGYSEHHSDVYVSVHILDMGHPKVSPPELLVYMYTSPFLIHSGDRDIILFNDPLSSTKIFHGRGIMNGISKTKQLDSTVASFCRMCYCKKFGGVGTGTLTISSVNRSPNPLINFRDTLGFLFGYLSGVVYVYCVIDVPFNVRNGSTI